MRKEWGVDAVTMSAATQGMFTMWVFGALFWSSIADRFGRLPAALGSTWGSIVFSAFTTLATSFTGYFILRSLCGFFIGGMGSCVFVLLVEWSLQRDAALLTTAANTAFSLAALALAGIAALGDGAGVGWRGQQLILCGVVALPLFFSWPLRESPRFLLDKGRAEQAEAAVRSMTGSTGTPPAEWWSGELVLPAGGDAEPSAPASALGTGEPRRSDELRDDEAHNPLTRREAPSGAVKAPNGAPREAASAALEVASVNGARPRVGRCDTPPLGGAPPGAERRASVAGAPTGAWALLCSRTNARRLLAVAAVWFACNLIFYGLDFAVGSCDPAEGCNIYTNAAIVAVADVPGYIVCWRMADSPRFGRRLTLAISFLVAGVSLLGMAMLRHTAPGEPPPKKTALDVLEFFGKCGAAAAFQLAYIYPTELFPASIRTKSLGIANMAGRVACIVAPQAANVPKLTVELVLGGLSVVVALITLSLPETLKAGGAPA